MHRTHLPDPARRRWLIASTAVPLAAALPARAHAAAYPDKPLRILVPFAAGGTADMIARLLANKLGQRLGQPVIVESRAGANGIIGADAVAKSPADGYTLLLHSSAHTINAGLYKKLPFDTTRDFAAVAPIMAPGPFVVVVNPALPVRNVQELLAHARSQPDALTYGSAGIGNAMHLAGEMLAQMGKVKLLHVPYRGAAPIINDLVGNQIQLMFNSPLAVEGFVREGKLRLLAQTGLQRSPALPDLPTVAESGLPGYELTSWYGLYAPASTPVAIVERLNNLSIWAMNQPDVQQALAQLGTGLLLPTTPAQFEAFTRSEMARYAQVIRTAHLSLEAS